MTGIIPGQNASANETMNAFGSNFNDTAQMIFNADYVGFDSRLSNSGTPSLKNVFYSTFTSDDVDENFGFVYDSTNDLYFIPDLSGVNEYVIIEADSYNGDWNNGTNNTFVVQIDSGKWLVYCDTGTDAVQRAQIHKTLWTGTNQIIPTDQLILDFTNVSSVKTSHANDVGKQAYQAQIREGSATSSADNTGTFANTTTNNNCSSWSFCKNDSSTSDEMGKDTTGDELNNPSSCDFSVSFGIGNNASWQIPNNNIKNQAPSSSSVGRESRGIILCEGNISWVATGTFNSATNIDYKTTHSIPDMTSAGSLISEGLGNGTLIFKNTTSESITNAIPVINSQIDAASSEQISISADGGSNYTDVNNSEIARPTAGTELWRRIVITRTDLSKEDKVTEQAIKHNFY